MKQQSFMLTDTTVQEFETWCTETGNPAYKKESKEKFFNLVINKKLVRDESTGKLIRKRPRKK